MAVAFGQIKNGAIPEEGLNKIHTQSWGSMDEKTKKYALQKHYKKNFIIDNQYFNALQFDNRGYSRLNKSS
ncbi:MAG: hypothetical protein MUE99_04300 [Chitinophagaceae bacterium]|nr:hypothetical protein [Chitinophagaceae bacterium]